MELTIKTRETQGFKPRKQGKQELPGLILQSMIDGTYY